MEQEKAIQRFGRRRKVLIVLAVCTLLGLGLVAFWPRNNEPRYNGKTLTQWLEISRSRRYDNRWPQAEDAVKQVGTNALPWLIKWAHYDRPAWQNKTAQSKFWRFLPRRLYVLVYNREYQTIWAMEGFRILAPTSPQVSAELERLMDGFPQHSSALGAFVTVHNLGPAGLPIFFNVATNRNKPAPLRCAAIQGIGNVYSQAKTTTPSNLATNNLPIVPGLLRCLQDDSDLTVRTEVRNALRMIAPEVLTNGISDF